MKEYKLFTILLIILIIGAYAAVSLCVENNGEEYVHEIISAVEQNDISALRNYFSSAYIDDTALMDGVAALQKIWSETEYSIQLKEIDTHSRSNGQKWFTENYEIVTDMSRYEVALEYEFPKGHVYWFCLKHQSGEYGAISNLVNRSLFQYHWIRPWLAYLSGIPVVFSIWCLVSCCKRKPPYWKWWIGVILVLHLYISVDPGKADVDWFCIPFATLAIYFSQLGSNLAAEFGFTFAVPYGALIYCIVVIGGSKTGKMTSVPPLSAATPVPTASNTARNSATCNSPPAPDLVQRYNWVMYIPFLNGVILSVLYFVDSSRDIRKFRSWRYISWSGRSIGIGLALAVPLLVTMIIFNPNERILNLCILGYELLSGFWISWEICKLDKLFRKRKDKYGS